MSVISIIIVYILETEKKIMGQYFVYLQWKITKRFQCSTQVTSRRSECRRS